MTAPLLSWQDFENFQARAIPEVRVHLTIYRRVYEDVPAERVADFPTLGQAVADLKDQTSSGIATLRVFSVGQIAEQDGLTRFAISFYAVRAGSFTPSTNYTEVNGSRDGVVSGESNVATRLFATDDGATGLPAIGEGFPGDAGNFPRRCLRISKNQTYLPGLYWHECQYVTDVAF